MMMTKSQLQKELKEKVREGIKPSDLKKLKRSKSADDIPSAPPPPNLQRSKSSEHPQDEPILNRSELFSDPKYPYTTLISQQEELDKLKKETVAKSDTIKLLRQKIENLEQSNPPNQLLADQLKEKQKEVEELRAKLERANNSLSSLEKERQEKNAELQSLKSQHSSLLDTNLELKHQSLKDWWTQYQQTQGLEEELSAQQKELKENVDYAAEELVNQDKVIENLRNANTKLQQTNQSLQKDLDLTSKLAELRRNPLPDPPLSSPWITHALTFLLIGMIIWLIIR